MAARLGVEPSPFASEAAVLETACAAAHLRAIYYYTLIFIKSQISSTSVILNSVVKYVSQ